MKLFRLIAIFLCIVVSVSCSKVEVEGLPAPEFTAQTFSGDSLSLSEFKGKPVILYWFASW
ncbi:MAG: hypothetical protein A2X87_02770 [Deltaproteobacteria bacterium GWC2_42_51]|nr:MAG: hypothetical protein A2056_00530 [Deltaproteobacteria bacterium GWA2_42_85]OGP36598.1 MAG: hypothetical protein A2X87_02770 [Deltaproteobacteria bacterium GWC2_42_51]OGP40249.1 MAG: hypothetical protein A2090_10840 [Deltaproteobacteria bacterium GWD2_42_10]OGP47059.1 MAG: hypothetical protein A2022_07255 [Deltaproteobacteria bacterium GWF2_42_12]OGQ26940.1 MAG: hypothetical protein A3D29_04015 [Deltaproteobacteria bacterium RIFCSPHIGHO2_02_FULL_42_44]OGQ36339.1 MAG: hypothetical protei